MNEAYQPGGWQVEKQRPQPRVGRVGHAPALVLHVYETLSCTEMNQEAHVKSTCF